MKKVAIKYDDMLVVNNDIDSCKLFIIRNPFNYKWTIYDENMNIIDMDQYLNDLAERNSIDLFTKYYGER